MKVHKWIKWAGAALVCLATGVSTSGGEVESLPKVSKTTSTTEFKEPLDYPESVAPPKNPVDVAGGDTFDSDCDLSSNCCAAPKCRKWLVGGAEAAFLWPDFHRSSHNLTFVNSAGVNQQLTYASDATKVDHSMLVGPRLWLGVQGCKWGVVGRYFNLGDTASGISPVPPSFGTNQVYAIDSFRAYYADLEGVRSFCLGRWSTNASFGVRYASVNLGNSLTSNLFTSLGEMVTASSTSRTGFSGTGITMGLWGSRQIRPCSAWNWFYSARASVLWGNNTALAQTSATTVDAIGAATSLDSAFAKSGGDLFIGELQYGVQWERQLKCIPSRAFFRFAGEYQYWDACDSVFAAAASGAVAPLSTGYAEAVSGTTLFDLVGFTIGAGLTY